MQVDLNPSTTAKPQPMTATKPHQYLPPTEKGQQLGVPPGQSVEDTKSVFHALLVQATANATLQKVTDVKTRGMTFSANSMMPNESLAARLQRSSFLLARLLNT